VGVMGRYLITIKKHSCFGFLLFILSMEL